MPWQTTSVGLGITQLFSNFTAGNLGPGGQKVLGAFQFSAGSSYNALIYVQNNGGTATKNDAANIAFSWTDGNNNLLDLQEYWMLSATATLPHIVQIKGPAVGPQLYITLNTYTAAGVTTKIGVQLYQDLVTQRIRHDARSQIRFNNTALGSQIANNLNAFSAPLGAPAFPGWNLVQCEPPNSRISDSTIALAATSQQTFLLPLYAGNVSLSGNISSNNANDCQILIKNEACAVAFQGVSQQCGYTSSGPSGGELNIRGNFGLPRSQCSILVANNNAAAQTVSFSITAIE